MILPRDTALLDSGLEAHRRGDLDAALALYREILRLTPEQPDALHLAGTALLQRGDVTGAIPLLEKAVRQQRNNPGFIGNLAHAYFSAGRFDDAAETFRKARRLEPRDIQFSIGLANSLAMGGKRSEAEALFRKLTQQHPGHPLVWFNLGNVLRDDGRFAEAVAPYQKAIELDPGLIDARNNLGSSLHSLLRFDEAEREYRACLATDPENLLAQPNLASVLIDQGKFGEAEDVCREMIRQIPDWDDAWTCLGSTLGHQGRLLEALECHRRVTEINPDDQKALEVYAAALGDAGFFQESERWFSRALARVPESPLAHQGMFFVLLCEGRLTDGWDAYRYRTSAERLREKYREAGLSTTLPADVNGKRICILREQGLGDEFFFLRYAPQLKAAGARIIYRGSNKIASLLSRLDCIDELLDEHAPLPDADAAILVADLPHALSTQPMSPVTAKPDAGTKTLETNFSRRVTLYWPPVPPSLRLQPLADRIDEMRARLARTGPPPYLGITWRGGTPPQEQTSSTWVLYKAVPTQALGTAMKSFAGTLISLQRKPVPGETEALSAAVGRPIHDFSDLNEDLEGMLALLALVDEYVGVSNTNMHMRAMVGRTARVLVPCPAEWRWLFGRASTPWFPGFAIYRQTLQGNWQPAISALATDLAQRLTAQNGVVQTGRTAT